MSDQSSVVMLVNAMLLALDHRHATRAVLHRDVAGPVVEFEYADGRMVEEIRIPEAVFAHVVRRIAIVSRMPYRRRHEIGTSQIHVTVGDARHLWFEVEISGVGPTERVTLRPFISSL